MTTTINLDLMAGSLVFWKASMTPIARLRKAADRAGYPDLTGWVVMTPEAALHEALTAAYGRTRGVMIRKAKATKPNTAAAVVVSETLNDEGNTYTGERRFEIDLTTWEVSAGDDQPYDSGMAQQYRDLVTGRSTSQGIANLLEVLGATKLRDNTRVFFVPASLTAKWDGIAKCFSDETGISFFKTHCPADADTAAAVADNALEEMRARYQAILDDLDACSNRMAQQPKASAGLRARRAELLGRLEEVKLQAARLDAGFKGLLNVAETIGNEIDNAQAIAALLTAAN